MDEALHFLVRHGYSVLAVWVGAEQLGLPVAKIKSDVAVPVENKTILQGLEAENRQKLWRWFIAATLAVLLVESALAGWTARHSARQTEEATT